MDVTYWDEMAETQRNSQLNLTEEILIEIAASCLGNGILKVHPAHYLDKPTQPQSQGTKTPGL